MSQAEIQQFFQELKQSQRRTSSQEEIPDGDCKEAYANASKLMSEGYYIPAKAVFRQIIGNCKQYWSVWSDFGLCCYKLGEYGPAMNYFQQALQMNPDSFLTWYNLGTCYTKTGQYDKAIPAYRSALQFEPEDTDLWYNLGFSYFKLGQKQPAKATFTELIALKPSHKTAHYYLAVLAVGDGDKETALQHLEAIAPLDDSWKGFVEAEEAFAPLHAESRYQAIL